MRRCPRERSARLALLEEIELVQTFTTSAAYVNIALGGIPTSLFLRQTLLCCAYLFLVFLASRICLSTYCILFLRFFMWSG